ncbi:hypothetical protein Htur_4366 (plasmid) [Haloterrigena turkmenica DSM 5511]|uniref:Solute symporter protein n=1 Tax=Haloterrigena turkmenica (strain ATCC 51198 / DSM 5511 / JCM 9101 / NCIMB 13204 / VKM B-1734 / 4k) TaxID=543526 RepID=D2S1D2_HALTV|nr:hypothetical protein [Haloterrigena turkmenica]ADB63179.1 hypothetical protein Htur_4366 [Haloterrigena turkmenica DSM 5511]
MQTHTKEALASLGAALALIAVINAGIWFTMFGTPDLTVLGFPFHYFWLVAGGPAVMFVLYWIYYRYITTSIMEEKAQLKASVDAAGPTGEVGVEPGDDDD